jgi:hypothetical protein
VFLLLRIRRTWNRAGFGQIVSKKKKNNKQNMEIEVRQPNGGYYKAYVQSVNADGLLVAFENE